MDPTTVLKMIWEDKDFKDAVVESDLSEYDENFLEVDISSPSKQHLVSFYLDSNDERYLNVAASLLAGRKVEVEQTTDGQYIVLYMRFDRDPPSKEDSPVEALRSFIHMMLRLKAQERTMEPDRLSTGENNANNSGPAPGTGQ